MRGISLKNLYRPIVHLKGVTHYTLQDTACEKEYEQNCSYSFCFAAGKTCFMEDTLSATFLLCYFSLKDLLNLEALRSKHIHVAVDINAARP